MMKLLLSGLFAMSILIGCGGESKMRKEGEKAEVSEEVKKPSAPDFGSEKP